MAKRDNKILWIVGLIIVGLLLSNYYGLFSTINPCDNPNPLVDNGYTDKASNAVQSTSFFVRVNGDDSRQMNSYFKFKFSQDLINAVRNGVHISSASIQVYQDYTENAETIKIYTGSNSWDKTNLRWRYNPTEIDFLGSYTLLKTHANSFINLPLSVDGIENRIKAGDKELTIIFDGGASGNEVRFSSKQSGGNIYSCSLSFQSAQITINYNPPSSFCIPNWKCESWTKCINKLQTRNCYDSNLCNTNILKPITSQKCSNTNQIIIPTPIVDNIPPGCIPNWVAGDWGKCVNKVQVRTVTDSNHCGNKDEIPPTARTCGSFNLFEIFSALPNPFVNYPNNKDNPKIVFDLTQKQRPLMSGLQIKLFNSTGWYTFCTLGAIVKYQGRNVILTAAHCVETISANSINQGGENIGYPLIRDPLGTDSVLIALNSGINIQQVDAIGNEIAGFATPKNGMAVYKIGQTTGLTFGVIKQSDMGVNDGNGGMLKNKNGDYLREFEIKGNNGNGNFSEFGDSGAAVITVSSPHKIVGILQGKSREFTYAYRSDEIKNNLGISM